MFPVAIPAWLSAVFNNTVLPEVSGLLTRGIGGREHITEGDGLTGSKGEDEE